MQKTVGRFTIDGNQLYGPREYMEEQGNEYLSKMLRGDAVAFNMSSHLSPDLETAILVFMQTDYAGWAGTRDLLRSFGK